MKKQKTVLITGATGGIGKALCAEFARRGYRLILTGRNPARLKRLADLLGRRYGAEAATIAADLSIKGMAEELCARLDKKGEVIDVLVNNAGFASGSEFAASDPKTLREMLFVNVHAPTVLCRHFLPQMLARGSGRILNLASLGAYVAGPYNAVYCATKAYVLSLSNALSDEVKDTNVTVTALCPGATHTGFAHRANMESTLLFNLGVMESRQVAKAAYCGMMQGRTIVIPGIQTKVLITLMRFAPRDLSTRLSGIAQKPHSVEK